MKKKTKLFLTLIIGVLSFIVGFILYFVIPLSNNQDNIANEDIDNATNIITMLKINVDELDIINESQESIGKALKGEEYQVTKIDKIDDNVTYQIKYNNDVAYITINKINAKKYLEIYNEQDKKDPENVTITTNKNAISIPAEKEYYCEDGYTLEEDKCIKMTTKDAKSTEKIECSSGTYNKYLNRCDINVNYSLDSKANDYCDKNGLNDKKVCCEAVNGTYASWESSWCYGVTKKTISPSKVTVYSCEEGWKLNNDKCEKMISTKAKYKYTCSASYTLDQDQCIKNN